MPMTTLRLVDLSRIEPESYLMERRHEDRRNLSGSATVVSQGSTDNACRRIFAMELRNISPGGLGGVTREPVEIGAVINVFFPPHGGEPGFELTGTVARCEQMAQGRYSIGMKLAQRAAA